MVAQAVGMPLDDYLAPRLLEPLGVTARWSHDPHGHAQVHAGVRISAVDLVKIGVLMRDGGVWQGRQILPVGWVETAGRRFQAEGRDVGLGWFLIAEEPGPTWSLRGFQHTGDSGAFLVVLRDSGIVAAGVHQEGGPIGSVMSDVMALRRVEGRE